MVNFREALDKGQEQGKYLIVSSFYETLKGEDASFYFEFLLTMMEIWMMKKKKILN